MCSKSTNPTPPPPLKDDLCSNLPPNSTNPAPPTPLSYLLFSFFSPQFRASPPPLHTPSNLLFPAPPVPQPSTFNSLVFEIYRENKSLVLLSSCTQLVNAIAQSCLPLTLKYLIDTLSTPSPRNFDLYFSPCLISIVLFFQALSLHHTVHLTTAVSLKTTRLLLSLLHASTLRGGGDVGKLTQLVGSDLEMVRIALIDMHLVWR